MTGTRTLQIQKVFLLVFVVLFVVFIYTFLHESGHALVGLLSGGRITSFSVNFINLSAHVTVDGNLTPAQTIVMNLAGVSLPLLVWLVFILAVPKKANFALELIKVFGSIGFLNSLLPWIIFPLLFLAGKAPGDDSTSFLRNSGVHPLWVSITAFLIYLGGWVLFRAKIDRLCNEVALFRKTDQELITPDVRKTTVTLTGLFVLCGLLAFGFNGFKLSASRPTPVKPPQGYILVKTIDLTGVEYSGEAVYTFKLDNSKRVGIYLLVQDIDYDYFEVKLTGPNQYSFMILLMPLTQHR
ncbi:MAG: M50 family metallopeptidase [Firmicutes bacterium]|nr:M50 family metallopeptidase [Bacillota bacterium]